MGLERLQRLTHHAESLIGCLREGATATPDVVSAILTAVDQVKVLLGDLEETGQEPEGDDSDLIALLERQVAICQGGEAASAAPAEAPVAAVAEPEPEVAEEVEPEPEPEPVASAPEEWPAEPVSEIPARPATQETLDALVASLRAAKLDVRREQSASVKAEGAKARSPLPPRSP